MDVHKTFAQMFAQHSPYGACQSEQALCDASGAGYCDKGVVETKALCDSHGGGYCDPDVVKTKAMCNHGPCAHDGDQNCQACLTGPMVVEQVGADIANLGLPKFDLTKVRGRVEKENPGITEDQLERGEKGYRLFLQNCKLNPQSKLSPNLLVDEFWHAHILYTKEYMQDCRDYFGYYLHHVPRQ